MNYIYDAADLHTFVEGYIEALFWTETAGENGERHLDTDPRVRGLTRVARKRCEADCRRFFEVNLFDIDGRYREAGIDFLLTRNGHGCGFWDGDWEEEAGKRLTEAAHAFGEMYIELGRTGYVHVI